MPYRLSIGQGIAIAGVWIAAAAISIASLPFVVLIVPLIVPAAAIWGGVTATRMILGHGKIEHGERTEIAP